jgi:hypothetical protein
MDRAAAAEGESVSEFMLKAGLARAWMAYALRQPRELKGLSRLYDLAGRLLEAEVDRRHSAAS